MPVGAVCVGVRAFEDFSSLTFSFLRASRRQALEDPVLLCWYWGGAQALCIGSCREQGRSCFVRKALKTEGLVLRRMRKKWFHGRGLHCELMEV